MLLIRPVKALLGYTLYVRSSGTTLGFILLHTIITCVYKLLSCMHKIKEIYQLEVIIYVIPKHSVFTY